MDTLLTEDISLFCKRLTVYTTSSQVFKNYVICFKIDIEIHIDVNMFSQVVNRKFFRRDMFHTIQFYTNLNFYVHFTIINFQYF